MARCAAATSVRSGLIRTELNVGARTVQPTCHSRRFAVTGVDRGGRLRQTGPVHVVKWFALGIDAPQFTVEVFVGPALPSVVWLGEVDLAVERLGDPGMFGEFTAVIERDGIDRVLERHHHRRNRVGDGLDFTAEQFIDPPVRQFHFRIRGEIGDDVGTLPCQEAVVNVIEMPWRDFTRTRGSVTTPLDGKQLVEPGFVTHSSDAVTANLAGNGRGRDATPM